jgi:hypothetical protein
VSVILDALRRARGSAPGRAAGSPPAPGVPAGLRVGSPKRRTPKSGGIRWGLLLFLAAGAAAIWLGLQFGPTLLRRGAPVSTLTSAPQTAPVPVQAPETGAPPVAADEPPVQQDAEPSLTEMLERIQEPPAIAPRAMPGARDADADAPAPPAAARGRGAPSGVPARPAPARPPLAAEPAPAVSPTAPASPPTPAIDHFELAVRYHNLGNFAQALTHYNAVLVENEFHLEARNNLGLLYHGRGLTGEAVEQFRRAILINPQYLTARSNLAVVLMSAGRLAEARAELRAALALEPRNADLLVNMALVEQADQKPGEAVDLLLRALGEQPFHAAAHYNLAVLYDEAGELGRAQDHYTDFLAHAGPEHGQRLSDVRRRLDGLAPQLTPRQ